MNIPQQDNLLVGSSRDGVLPPGLNTAFPASVLGVDETPDSYGVALGIDGKIGKGTLPTGTARIGKTVTLDLSTLNLGNAVPFLLYYGRLWNITGLTNSGTSTTLSIGPQAYEDTWLRQEVDLAFTEDAQPILGIIPLGQGGMAVIKSTGSYVVENVYDPRGTNFFRRSDIIQEMYAANITHAVELDGVLYVSNANGLIAYEGGKTKDLTAVVRDDKSSYVSAVLTADYVNKRIIGTTASGVGFVWDVPSEKLHRYSGSSFRFTSRQWRHPQWYQVNVDALKFVIVHGNTNDGVLKFQYRFEDMPWSDEITVHMDYSNFAYTIVDYGLPERRNTYRFQIRVTSLDTGKYIQEVRMIGEAWNE